ncbi:MAG: type I-E CRISPR-associated protein Cas5/CasD [Chitinivibrionia bacterium]|nr:type I-E CRISPR-associated protein Cas5/CasD [Chitinivibrionia bacterium]
MTDYLLFRLYGPMASWGDIAVGEVRPSFTHPSKSAVLGIVAAALGLRRDDEQRQRSLAEGFGFAVRVESLGVPLVDYHTVQVPPNGAGKRRRVYSTRKDELSNVRRDDLSTILSRRDYRMDALATSVLWALGSAPPVGLEEIASALERPKFALYLGRKSCPLALPLDAQIVAAEGIADALKGVRFSWELDCRSTLRAAGPPTLFWEAGASSGIEARHTFERRDTLLSRKRWQFDVRREHQGTISDE